jgi:quinol monooxygenase YgiN
MSVIVTIRMSGDPAKLEEFAATNEDTIRGIAERAKGYGVIAHRFYGSDDGQIMVIDEWPDAESFQTFFGESASEIQPMLQQVGVTSEPEVTVWRKLDTRDDVGWE